MREEITIAELLFRLKDKKEKFDKLYNEFISKDLENNVFVTLKRCNNTDTLEGIDSDKFLDIANDYYSKILNIWKDFVMLSRIKDEINSRFYLYLQIPTPTSTTDERKWFSINEILMLKSSYYKDYYIKLAEKIESEYTRNSHKLSILYEKINDKDSVDRYVLARLNSLNIPFEKGYSENYEKFSKEYFNANKISFVSPIDVKFIIGQKEKYEKWCKVAEDKLFKLNMLVKIWIDETYEEHIWGVNTSKIELQEIDAKFETVV